MKKLFITTLMLTILSGFFGIVSAAEKVQEMDPDAIRGAISKYKEKNYIGCISDLRIYTEKEMVSTVWFVWNWYNCSEFLYISYMFRLFFFLDNEK